MRSRYFKYWTMGPTNLPSSSITTYRTLCSRVSISTTRIFPFSSIHSSRGQHIPSCFLYAKRFQTGNGPCLCSPPLEGRHSRRFQHPPSACKARPHQEGALPCTHLGVIKRAPPCSR